MTGSMIVGHSHEATFPWECKVHISTHMWYACANYRYCGANCDLNLALIKIQINMLQFYCMD